MDPIWLIAALLVAAPFAARVYLLRRRQMREMIALARRRKLRFSAVDLIGLHDRYYNLGLIRRGHSRHAWNVLYGSTEAGLIAAFRYNYDLGFGTRRESQQWWLAVLESTRTFDNWRAEPVPEASGAAAEADGTRIGPFAAWADRAETMKRLEGAAMAAALLSVPGGCHIEARGPLLAIACAAESDFDNPERLIDGLLLIAGAHAQPGTVVRDSRSISS